MEIFGNVVSIRFQNQENFFTVIDLETEDGRVTVRGNMPLVNLGDELKIEGEIDYHPKYGEQINAYKVERVIPRTPDQIIRYLSSGIIPFIGEKTAQKIVELFGEKALEIIQEDEKALRKIPGIGKKKSKLIREKLIEERDLREFIIFMQTLGLGPRTSRNIYDKYGDKTIEILQTNPYKLIDEIERIGFQRADKIALKNGIRRDSEFRIKSGLIYILKEEAYTNGNIYVKKNRLKSRLKELLSLDDFAFEDILMDLQINSKIKVDGKLEGIYLNDLYKKERYIASSLVEILEEKSLKKIDVSPYIGSLTGLDFSQEQKLAIEGAVNNKIMIITGGPGTGKTTIIKTIIKIFEDKNIEYALAAPTGRAAKRMEESTGIEAKTLHRLLGFKGIEGLSYAEFNEENLLPYQALIVDEVSMVDVNLMDSLMRALPRDLRLIVVGDQDQLPSVGPGSVLSDMIKSKKIPLVKLHTIFRQNEDSNIVVNAHRINEGKPPILNEKDKGFYFLNARTEAESLHKIIELVNRRLPSHYKFSQDDIQVMSPMRRGICGVDNLNIRLQESLNPEARDKNEMEYKDVVFRENDKVMQIKNNYNLNFLGNEDKKGVYNGDIGIISQINYVHETLRVIYDDKIVEYESKDISELAHSYAITIHKSQGSEFPCVVIPIVEGPYMLLTRNLLYTAITRAKKLVVLVGDKRVLEKMIENNRIDIRNSSLGLRIKEYCEIKDMGY